VPLGWLSGHYRFDGSADMADNCGMSVNPQSVALSDSQKLALAELADFTGKPWPEVLSEALSAYRPKPNKKNGESFSAAATRLKLVGCVAGPADLSTNPAYMEGFGEREK
jgi:hypothetical protein